MKFKLDENLPASSTAILAKAGHDVDTVADEALAGAPDQDVVAAATAAGRILISLDRGLGDIRAYPPGSHAGIVVLRLTDQSGPESAVGVVEGLLDDLCTERPRRHDHYLHAPPQAWAALVRRYRLWLAGRARRRVGHRPGCAAGACGAATGSKRRLPARR